MPTESAIRVLLVEDNPLEDNTLEDNTLEDNTLEDKATIRAARKLKIAGFWFEFGRLASP